MLHLLGRLSFFDLNVFRRLNPLSKREPAGKFPGSWNQLGAKPIFILLG
jgi:hypothetical protein